MTHTERFFSQVTEIATRLDYSSIERMVEVLLRLRDGRGRLFFLGVGGSAANCSHAVNDFRKIARIEAYTPCDNVAELTARTNDEGWSTVFAAWLETSRAGFGDVVFVLSVGGGSLEPNVSPNIVAALNTARERGVTILGIVGRDGGYTKQIGDEVLLIPTVDPSAVTPHAEAFQALVWHCLVTHPRLIARPNKWEGMQARSV